ncbi:MAG: hypothetical protein JW863_16235 [Chitinispirillaceae bacterium]|nr:hypothetical protein [Chitinispirillaceae bacterium]
MRWITAIVLAILLCLGVYGQVDTSKSKFWMMTYFINGQDYTGARLAFSSDSTGISWQKYNNEQSIITPVAIGTAPDNSRMRDPMIAYDSINRRFNMIWTVAWTGTWIGWDTSSLLKSGTWGPQVGLNISGGITNAYFSWAPEIFWDDIQNRWMIYWSVSVTGSNTRMYYSMVNGTDFKTFSQPQVLINTGYDLIDGSIIKTGPGNYQMFFKDERTGYKYIRRASGATTPQGPYNKVSSVVANASTEGPTVVFQGGEYHVFVDHYSNQGLGVVKSKNIDTSLSPWPETWCTFGSSGSRLVVSHCNVIEVPKMLVKWMLHSDSAWVRYVRNRTALKEFCMAPSSVLKGSGSVAGVKLFDLTGRVVGIVNSNGVSAGTPVGRLPAGFYATTDGRKKLME